MLVSIFLMFKCLTRRCQCERWGWRRSKKGPGKSLFIFLVHIHNIHRSRNLPSVQEEKEERYLFWYFLNTSVHMYQAWVVMFQKCPEKKKTPSLRPTQAPWPFAWKYSKYFWKKRQSQICTILWTLGLAPVQDRVGSTLHLLCSALSPYLDDYHLLWT